MANTRAASALKIGASHGAIAFYNAWATPMPDPLPEPMHYSAPRVSGAGTQKLLGWVELTLHWANIGVTAANQLRALQNTTVYFTAPDDLGDGTIKEWTGTLLWPAETPEIRNREYMDLNIRIVQVTLYVP